MKINFDDTQRAIYEMREKTLHDNANALYSATLNVKVDVVKELLNLFDDEKISEIVKLDIDIIKKIRNENK